MQPLLETRHLRMLTAIAESASMTAAAALLGLTQSALSHRLCEAERRLGTELFERGRGGLKLTPAGERLLLTARRLLTDLLRAESDVRQMAADGVRQVGRMGQAWYASLSWYGAFHAACRAALPDLRIEMVGDSAERPLDLLAEGVLDVAVIAGGVWRPGILRLPLFEDPLLAVCAPTHPWSRLERVLPQHLTSQTFLSFGFVPTPGFEHQRFMSPTGAFPARTVKVGRPEALIELVAAGQGISILSAWAISEPLRQGRIVARPLGREGLLLPWLAAVREGDAPDAAGPRLARMLEAWCRDTGGFGSCAS